MNKQSIRPSTNIPDGQRPQTRIDRGVDVPVPDRNARGILFSDNANADRVGPIEDAVTIKSYNSASNHYCFWVVLLQDEVLITQMVVHSIMWIEFVRKLKIMNKLQIMRLMALYMGLVGSSNLRAEDPSVGFAEEVLKLHQETRFNFWNGGANQPDGGMIVRSEFDVNGDGVDDWLFKSTLETGDNYAWSVYVKNEDSVSKLRGSLLLNGVTYVKREGGETILTSIHREGVDWLGITINRISNKGKITTERKKPIEGFEEVSQLVSQKGWPEFKYGELLKRKKRATFPRNIHSTKSVKITG